jgi:hypothetical protein
MDKKVEMCSVRVYAFSILMLFQLEKGYRLSDKKLTLFTTDLEAIILHFFRTPINIFHDDSLSQKKKCIQISIIARVSHNGLDSSASVAISTEPTRFF